MCLYSKIHSIKWSLIGGSFWLLSKTWTSRKSEMFWRIIMIHGSFVGLSKVKIQCSGTSISMGSKTYGILLVILQLLFPIFLRYIIIQLKWTFFNLLEGWYGHVIWFKTYANWMVHYLVVSIIKTITFLWTFSPILSYQWLQCIVQ